MCDYFTNDRHVHNTGEEMPEIKNENLNNMHDALRDARDIVIETPHHDNIAVEFARGFIAGMLSDYMKKIQVMDSDLAEIEK